MKESVNEVGCNVIGDLMPSYLDAICSEEGRSLVDRHLKNCAQCRARLELLRNTELSDEMGESEKVSYLRKVKRHYVNKEVISILLLAAAVMGGFWSMHHTTLGIDVLYMAFPLFLFVAYSMVPGSAVSPQVSKLPWILDVTSILLLAVYFMIVILWDIPIGRGMNYVFDIPPGEVGKYLHRWINCISVLQTGVFAVSNFLRVRGYRIHKALYGLTLTGVALAAGYLRILGNMTTVELLYGMLTEMIVCVGLEGILFSALSCYLVKKLMR